MSLDVSILPLEPLALVRLSVDAAGPWRVTGRTDGGWSWLAGEGSGPAVFADPWAPLGVALTYELTAGTSRVEAGPLMRTHRGQNAMTDLTGRTVVDFAWTPDPGNPRTYDPRVAFLDVPGADLPSFMSAPVAGAGAGSLTARTVPPHSEMMRRLVYANRPLLLLHSHSGGRCPIVDCDIPAVQTVMMTAVGEDRRRRADVAERSWALSYRLVARPYRYLAPVATWGDVERHWPTTGDLADSGLSTGDLAAGDWLVGW